MNGLFDSLTDEEKKQLLASISPEQPTGLPPWMSQLEGSADLVNRGPDSLRSPEKKLVPSPPVPGVGDIFNTKNLQNLPPGKSESKSNTKVNFKSDTKTKPFDLGIKPDIEQQNPKIGEERKQAMLDFIKQKYGFGEGLDDDAIKAAQERAKKLQDGTNIWQFVSGLGGAISGRGLDQTNKYFDDLRNKIQDKEVGDIERRRKAKVEALGLAQALNKYGSEEEQRDPKSNASVTLRNTYKKLFPDIANKLPNFEALSAYDISTNLADPIKLLQRDKETKMEYDIRKQEIANRGVEAKASKAAAQMEKDVQKFSKEVAGVQNMTNALDEIETELGGQLEEFDTSGGNLKKDGKSVDLPGVSLPFFGRVSGYSDKAQRLQSAASKVFNSVLKDRSGAAVTNSELERLKTEFGEGKFNTEAQMVAALQRYKRGVEQELKNREAGYRPEVVETYSERGGRTSKQSAPAKSVYPKKLSKGGKQVTVSSPEEEKEAKAEGWN